MNWGGVLMPDETEPQFPPSNNGPQTPKRKSRLTSDVVDGMDLGGGGAIKPAAADTSAGSSCHPAPVGGGQRDSRRNTADPSPSLSPPASSPPESSSRAQHQISPREISIPPAAIVGVIVVVVVGILGFAFFGMVAGGNRPASDQPSGLTQIFGQQQTLTAKQIFDNSKSSVVTLAVETLKPVLVKAQGGVSIGVQEKGGIGSGFFVQPDIVATNCHVVGKPKDLELLKGGLAKITAKPGLHPIQQILWKDSDRDLALVYVPGTDAKPLPLGDCTKLQVGDSIYAIGSPIGMEGTITPGIISHETWRTFNNANWLQHSAPIDHGNSGGPLLNSHGEVIGINTLKIGEGAIFFAVPAFEIQKALDNPQVKEKLAIIQKQQRGGFYVDK